MNPSEDLPVSRWTLVAVAALAMGAVGTYQFVWSSVRLPLGARLGTGETALGTVFTVFLVFQSGSQFPAGWVRDRYGPRVPLLVGTPLLAIGYAGTALAESLPFVYAAYALGGIGSGVVYTVAVNTPVKWFTERRGLATGVVTMAYSGVSFLAIPLVRRGVETALTETLIVLGVGVALAALLAAVVVRDPPASALDGGGAGEADGESEPDGDGADDVPADAGGHRGERDGDTPEPDAGVESPAAGTYEWRETVRTWQFWLLYAVMIVVNGVGLMLIGKVVAYADALELPAAVATAGASVVAAADAAGIVTVGGVSDRLGRVRTVSASLVLSGVALVAATVAGAAAAAWPFAALVGAAALFRSPAFSVFPSLIGEYYGQRRSSENYALLYTGKVWGSVFGGTVASLLVVSLGWTTSFRISGVVLAVAGLATALLRPPE
ncbi:MFS transporter [Halobaculum sp. MBLA0147]|uniref:MFS transporter n=1 Tax=Halobaculum sp. MBLA0147 TaxID=3079934 RepID=UPI0035244C7B